MYNLILADLYKICKSMAIKILLGIAIVCAVAVSIMAYLIAHGEISKNLSGINFLISDASMLNILGAVIAGVFICGDFDNLSIHEAVANGNSRAAIIFSKAASFIIVLLIIMLPYAVATGICFFTGSKFSIGSSSMGFMHLLATESGKAFSAAESGKLLALILTLAIVYIGQLSICLLFAIVFKKPVIVVALTYALAILCGQLVQMKGNYKVLDNILACTPYGGNYAFLTLSTGAGSILKAIAVSVIFTIVMIFITYIVFRKSEIK